jgi:hypothetical protein
MRHLMVALAVVLVAAVMPAGVAAQQAEEIVCGRIMGHSAPTATSDGSFVIAQPGDVAPAGTYIAVRAGTQITFPQGWVCVRATRGGQSVPVPGSPSGTTHTFVAFVGPGEAGYRAEPSPPPAPSGALGAVGGPNVPRQLPSTSTSR